MCALNQSAKFSHQYKFIYPSPTRSGSPLIHFFQCSLLVPSFIFYLVSLTSLLFSHVFQGHNIPTYFPSFTLHSFTYYIFLFLLPHFPQFILVQMYVIYLNDLNKYSVKEQVYKTINALIIKILQKDKLNLVEPECSQFILNSLSSFERVGLYPRFTLILDKLQVLVLINCLILVNKCS